MMRGHVHHVVFQKLTQVEYKSDDTCHVKYYFFTNFLYYLVFISCLQEIIYNLSFHPGRRLAYYFLFMKIIIT